VLQCGPPSEAALSFFRNILKPPFRVHPTEITGKVGDAVKLTVNRPATFEARRRHTGDGGWVRVDLSGQALLEEPGTLIIRVREQGGDWDKDFIDVPVTVTGAPAPVIELSGTSQVYISLDQRVADLEAWQRRHEGAVHGG
jgi:hypothetical protein